MTTLAARFPEVTEAQYPVTSEAMLKHLQKYGMDNSHTGYRGQAERYKSIKALMKDAWVLVAASYFAEETFVQLVDAAGYGQFEAEARKAWKEMREQEEA